MKNVNFLIATSQLLCVVVVVDAIAVVAGDGDAETVVISVYENYYKYDVGLLQYSESKRYIVVLCLCMYINKIHYTYVSRNK